MSKGAPRVARDNDVAGGHYADLTLVAYGGEAERQVRPRAQQPQPCLHPFQRLLSWDMTYDHTSTNVKMKMVTVLKPQAPSSRSCASAPFRTCRQRYNAGYSIAQKGNAETSKGVERWQPQQLALCL